jgi:hydrogenase maturation protease
MKKIGVIGVGNPLRRDDGIGIVLLEELKKEKKLLPKGIHFVDGGTGGMNLLHIIAGFDIVFIIDAIYMNAQPGECRLFTADEIVSNKVTFSFSTHDFQLPHVIEMSRQLGELPEQVFIFGVQPKDVSFKKGLTKDLDEKICQILDIIVINLKNVVSKT